jgi:hypothetical protein
MFSARYCWPQNDLISIPRGYGGADDFYVCANHSTLTRFLHECD